ncbi:MAG: DUF402 domain-containing protein [Chloroflexota bacterium]
MLSRRATITKVGPDGQAKISYPGEIVFQDEAYLVARCLWTQPHSLDLGPFALDPGDVFIEFYYLAEWFNVFTIYDRLGRLKGWYCNITRPAEVLGDEIRWHDLALDLLVVPGGAQQVLDEDDFAALTLSEGDRAAARDALDKLQRWAREGRAPFGRAAAAEEARRGPHA